MAEFKYCLAQKLPISSLYLKLLADKFADDNDVKHEKLDTFN